VLYARSSLISLKKWHLLVVCQNILLLRNFLTNILAASSILICRILLIIRVVVPHKQLRTVIIASTNLPSVGCKCHHLLLLSILRHACGQSYCLLPLVINHFLQKHIIVTVAKEFIVCSMPK